MKNLGKNASKSSFLYYYTRQKKKRTTTVFPFRSPFNTKMLIVMKYSFLIKFY